MTDPSAASRPLTIRSASVTTPSSAGRLRLYLRAALVAVAAAFVISVVGASGADGVSGRLGGDYPAFHAAGAIVGDGDWDRLYDPDRQLEAQAALFGDADGSFLYFAYPPHVAVLYRPLAALPYRAGYAVHTLVMAAALVAALWVIRPMVPIVDRHFETVVTASLLCYPMLRAVTGGQNTACSLLLIAGAWRLLADDRDLAAGLALALLMYKPQLAVPIVGLLLVGGRFRAVAGAAAGTIAVWAVGAGVMGPNWLGAWWTEVSAFAQLDADVNGHNAISWPGVAEALFGAGTTTARAIGWPLAVVTGLAAIAVWRRRDMELSTRMAVAVAAAVMASPHAMFYDAGLLVLPAVVALDRAGRRGVAVIVAVAAMSWVHVGADLAPVAPLWPVVVAFLVWAGRTLELGPRKPAATVASAGP